MHKCTHFSVKSDIFATNLQTMRHFFLFLCLFIAFIDASAQRRNQAYENYIEKYKYLAMEQMERYDIPASITLAQGLLESGAGMSTLARRSNNHFGIKCHDWTGKRTYHDDDKKDDCFRVYDNVRDSYEDHSKFLATRPRYKNLFKLKTTDYKGWAKGLKKAGYATSRTYASQLIGIIELYELDQYDKKGSYDKFIARHSGSETDGIEVHTIYKFNKNYYVKARQGDTFKSLSKELKISRRALAKYNERDKDDVFAEGDIIYLKQKRSKASKDYKKHIHYVRSGESMYLISQYYGIRLKSLYKINKLDADYQIKPGDALKVR